MATANALGRSQREVALNWSIWFGQAQAGVKTGWWLPATGLTDAGNCREVENRGVQAGPGPSARKLRLLCHISEPTQEHLISVLLDSQ